MKKLFLFLILIFPTVLFSESRVVLVTGASTGIGHATCEELAKSGATVYATMRNPDCFEGFSSPSIKIKKLDVTDGDMIDNVLSEIISEQGRLDVLVNNAGYLLLGPCETLSMDQIKGVFETNFFGAVAMMQATLPYMRQQKSGHIINISSTAAFDPFPGLDAYAATKGALENFSSALAGYVNQFGIKISLIEPGPVKTNLFTSLIKGENQLEDNPYADFSDNLNNYMIDISKKAQDASEVGELISRVVHKDLAKFRFQTDIKGVKRAQNRLVDITGFTELETKQSMMKEFFISHADE